MPGFDPGIHSVTSKIAATGTEWIAGSSPAMTTERSASVLPPYFLKSFHGASPETSTTS